MKTKKQSCCFCFNIALEGEGNVVNTNILVLLKFLLVNADTNVLENSTVCNGCLNSILETCEYKRRNSVKIAKSNKEIDSEKPTMCQKCKKLCEPGDSFRLMDCITQIQWSDFVRYLFADQDLGYLGNSHICNSCRISVSNIQHILKLLSVYDQYNINNCDETKATGNKDSVENEVKIKKETESYDLISLENLIENEHIEMMQINGHINYENFKLKNEEVDLKFECNYDDDTDQSTHEYEKVDVGKEISSEKSYVNIANEGKEHEVNHAVLNDLEKLKNDFLKCEVDNITNKQKLYNCNLCNCKYLTKKGLSQHKIKHYITNRISILKCYRCTYETYHKGSLFNHVKIHLNIKNFKCTFCSKEFSQKVGLDNHLLKIHKCKDVRKSRKLYNCDHCSDKFLTKSALLRHKTSHGITDGVPVWKCYQCTFVAYGKHDLIRHVKIHQSIKDFKCTYCLKEFTLKGGLENHLLKFHKYKGAIKKLYNCDHCGYETLVKREMLFHKLKHGIKSHLQILKCHHCTFETYRKCTLIKHMKIYGNIKDFKCTYCSKEFSRKRSFESHLLRIHKCKTVSKKLYTCDRCSFETYWEQDLLLHKVKHGITSNLQILKCYQCTFTTYYKSNLNIHIKKHDNVKS